MPTSHARQRQASRSPVTRSHQDQCHSCLPHKSETSRFIDRISNYVNEGQLSDVSSMARARSTTASSHNTMSEAEDLLYMNQHKMRSSTTMKTRSTKASSTETLQKEVDEFISSNALIFPSCYHPITSIGFQCKELKLHLDKSSISYKIVRGIEYNLGRLSADMLDTKWTEGSDPAVPDAESQHSVAKQAGKLKDLKMLCKSLKEEKQSVQSELDAQLEASLAWKSKEKDLIQAKQELTSKLEDSMKKMEEYCKALSSSAQLITELQDENKVVPFLRSLQVKLNERIEVIVRENELLKLDVQKLKLERESFRTLLQNKDAEIKKFKDEITEVQRAAAEQFTKLQTLNHEHRLKQIGSRPPYSAHTRSDMEGFVSSKESAPLRDRLTDEMYICRALWEGGGESRPFPASSSPSSDNSNMSLGPYPSWEQISPITSELTNNQSKEETLAQDKGDMPSVLEEGPYEMSEETMQHLKFLRMHSSSSLEQSQMQEQVTPVSHRQAKAPDRSRQELRSSKENIKAQSKTVSQPISVPSLPKPKPFIDLMAPPSELSHWSESCDDFDMFSVSNPDFMREQEPK